MRALIEDIPESSLTLPECEEQQEEAMSDLEMGPYYIHQICQHLDLGLPSLQNCEK